MELLDIVNFENVKTGEILPRDEVHKYNLWHRHVSAWILNEDGDVLMQQRSFAKDKNPGKWSKTGGHVSSGESEIVALQREIFEELGIKVLEKDLEFEDVMKSKKDTDRYFAYSFLAFVPKDTQFHFNDGEVVAVKWYTIEELEELKREGNNDFTFSKWDDTDFYQIMQNLKQKRKQLKDKK